MPIDDLIDPLIGQTDGVCQLPLRYPQRFEELLNNNSPGWVGTRLFGTPSHSSATVDYFNVDRT